MSLKIWGGGLIFESNYFDFQNAFYKSNYKHFHKNLETDVMHYVLLF